ncbi:hypothetical protein E8E12_002204 [Didymella heteroderae]|uniref:Extracellular serine-rich protein n=1 Tax=Didymella heteroderae TaxID=1769908 RepID=A0A9P4WGA7_9PLEO|nr:hypothetical protein E8E12_002204 [Didymella heteroderae]
MVCWKAIPIALLLNAGLLFMNGVVQADSSASSIVSTQSLSSTTSSPSDMTSTMTPLSSQTASQDAAITTEATSRPSSAEGSPRTPRVHLVKAGAGGFVFSPNELTNVSVGDTVTFEFYPPDHSVARAEFGVPCSPYEYTGKGKVGFWSETQWVNTTEEITHWNLTINSTEPIFYYCAAPDSCKGKQMVGVINPNSTQTLASQIVEAARSDYQIAPGEPVPKESSSETDNQGPRSAKLSDGAIVGVAIGSFAFLLLLVAILWYPTRRHRRDGTHRNDNANRTTAIERSNNTLAPWTPTRFAAEPHIQPDNNVVSPLMSPSLTTPVELPGSDTPANASYFPNDRNVYKN